MSYDARGPEKTQAMMDQAAAASRDLARLTLAFWSSLVAGGMPHVDATTVTAAWVAASVGANKP